MNKSIAKKSRSKSKFYDVMTEVWKYRFIYFLLLPATVLVIMFSYIPMVGIKMAFQDYNVYDPAASTWVGLQNFKELFKSSDSIAAIMNTFKISIWSLIVSFPLTVIFALLLNELRNKIFKKVIQTVSYHKAKITLIPHSIKTNAINFTTLVNFSMPFLLFLTKKFLLKRKLLTYEPFFDIIVSVKLG